MKKLCFIGNGEPPSKLLEIFRKQTPGSKGVWGNLQGVDNYNADYFAVIDNLPGNVNVDRSKCVFLGAHPETIKPYVDMDNFTCLAKADCKNTIGFLEWWIKEDYDYLKNLKPPVKTKNYGAIMSDAESAHHHKLRKQWLQKFTSRNDIGNFNLYGRIKPSPEMAKHYRGVCGSWDPRGAAASNNHNNHMEGKEIAYLEHKYMLEFDAIGKYYFSERVLDCMLLWAMPIYFGCQNLQTFLPVNSFRYLDINGNGNDVLSIVNSTFYEDHLNDLAKARDILLDELQLWPRIHKFIFSTNK